MKKLMLLSAAILAISGAVHAEEQGKPQPVSTSPSALVDKALPVGMITVQQAAELREALLQVSNGYPCEGVPPTPPAPGQKETSPMCQYHLGFETSAALARDLLAVNEITNLAQKYQTGEQQRIVADLKLNPAQQQAEYQSVVAALLVTKQPVTLERVTLTDLKGGPDPKTQNHFPEGVLASMAPVISDFAPIAVSFEPPETKK